MKNGFEHNMRLYGFKKSNNWLRLHGYSMIKRPHNRGHKRQKTWRF